MADNVTPLRPAPEPSLDEIAAAYPRQVGMHYLYRAYASGMVPVSLADLLAAFQRYTAHVQARRLELQFVMSIRRYIEDRCWNDVYELPSAPAEAPYDRREALRASAAKGNRFSADILKRDYGE